MCKWIKASERLPELPKDTSRAFFCRNTVHGYRKVLFYGKSRRCLLVSEIKEWEWLDENFQTNYTMGFNDAKKIILQKVSNISL